ncbi:MAG: Dynamin-1-like protein, partial [Paramarteilia canceri]
LFYPCWQDNKICEDSDLSEIPVKISIFGKNIPCLSLIDLPGIIRVPSEDQSEAIDQLTYNLSLKYIKNPYSIILVIQPACIDISSSEALKIAKLADPEGARTIVVLTKLDLTEQCVEQQNLKDNFSCNKDTMERLKAFLKPSTKIIGVVNKSRKLLDLWKLNKDPQSFEKKILEQLFGMESTKHGRNALVSTLYNMLYQMTLKSLPSLRSCIKDELKMVSNFINEHIKTPCGTEKALNLIYEFSNSYSDIIDGKNIDLHSGELTGGARICFIFHNIFYKDLFSLNALKGLNRLAILTTVRNSSGTSPPLFTPEKAFISLAKNQLAQLLNPCTRCINLVAEELQRIFETLKKNRKFSRFPKLIDTLDNTFNSILEQARESSSSFITTLIENEMSYINTNNTSFKNISFNVDTQAECEHIQNIDTSNLCISPAENKYCSIIEHLIQIYFDSVRNNLHDTVLKAIMNLMVGSIQSKMQNILINSAFAKDPEILLQESEVFTETRTKLISYQSKLFKAIENMKKFSC